MPLLEIATGAGPAQIVLDRPRSAVALAVLTHGAGGGVDSTDLLAVRDVLTGLGVAVARVLQPYRVAGRRTPPRPGPQDAAWLEVVEGLRRRRGLARVPLLLGGRSNGARVACRTAPATGAAAVLTLAFPLHPPGRPENSRLAELDAAQVPTLVVQGERDPFGLPPAGPLRAVVTIARADHTLGRDAAAVADAVRDFVVPLLIR